MKFTATIKALCPIDKRMKEFIQVIDLPCKSISEANTYVQDNFMGYMLIDGVCEHEEPFDTRDFFSPN